MADSMKPVNKRMGNTTKRYLKELMNQLKAKEDTGKKSAPLETTSKESPKLFSGSLSGRNSIDETFIEKNIEKNVDKEKSLFNTQRVVIQKKLDQRTKIIRLNQENELE